jgi:hypothetical protein
MATNRKSRGAPWNKGKIVVQKAPLKLREIDLRDFALDGSSAAT